MNPIQFDIVETGFYPAKWQIVAIGCMPNNSFTEFFRTFSEAQKEIKRRNGVFRRTIRLGNEIIA